jgi:transglutaminase-like putative cysteine protease
MVRLARDDRRRNRPRSESPAQTISESGFGLRRQPESGVGWYALLALTLVTGLALTARADTPAPLRRENWSMAIELNRDLTYTETIEQDYVFLTKAGIALADRDLVSFYPKSQRLELVEAYVIRPDGTRIDVPESARFTRPSAASQDTPGFTGSETTTVLFPQLEVGSRTHVVWRLTQVTPSVLGFNVAVRPLLEWPTRHMGVTITAPADLALRFAERGGFAVAEQVSDGRRRITASIDDVAAQQREPEMVASSDFQPMLVVTSLPDLAALGAIYHRQAADKAAVTPAIRAAAERIVPNKSGLKSGLEAARAIHDWVAANIRYVAVYLDPSDGWVPHSADEVLGRGYGDCKDHIVLLQALLAARGIKAEAALVDWGNRYQPFPLGVPQEFNHVIAWLPEFGLFANPTNPFARLGSLDRRLAGKTAVIATEHGEITHTPESQPEANRYRLVSELTVSADGTIEGLSRFALDGNIEAGAREDVAGSYSAGELANRMLAATPEGGYGEVLSTDPKDLGRPFQLDATWSSPHGITLQGGEAYFSTPVGVDFEQATSMLRPYLASGAARRHGVLTAAIDLAWDYTIHLPAGYVITRLPQDQEFTNPTGRYVAHYERQGGDLHVVRSLTVERDQYPAELYGDVQRLFFAALDDVRAVFVMARVEAVGATRQAAR